MAPAAPDGLAAERRCEQTKKSAPVGAVRVAENQSGFWGPLLVPRMRYAGISDSAGLVTTSPDRLAPYQFRFPITAWPPPTRSRSSIDRASSSNASSFLATSAATVSSSVSMLMISSSAVCWFLFSTRSAACTERTVNGFEAPGNPHLPVFAFAGPQGRIGKAPFCRPENGRLLNGRV